MISNTKPSKALVKTDVSGSRYVPMLFSTPMVRSILNGTKTETRRTQGLEKINQNPDLFRYDGFDYRDNNHYFERINIDKKPIEKHEPIKSKINIDDIIWVRETFTRSYTIEGEFVDYIYKADEIISVEKWKPSIYMPKSACRIFLKCFSVHVERLKNINEQSAINEGVERVENSKSYKDYFYKDIGNCVLATTSYFTLWQSINKDFDPINDNPFVWVYKFVTVDVPDDFR